MYTAISIIFLCIEVGLSGLLGYLIIKKKAVIDKTSLIYLLPTFILVYALYLTATIYNDVKPTFYTFFLLVHETLSMVAMELNQDLIMPLSEANGWFHAATIGACVLSFITIVFGVMALFGTTLINEIKKRGRFRKGGDLVIGASANALQYLKTHASAVLWAEKIEKEAYRDLIKKGYVVHKAPLTVKNIKKQLKSNEYHLIVFRDVSYSYLSVLDCFEELKKQTAKRIFLHLEVNADEMKIVREKYLSQVDESANSFIMPFCRYELMARRFIAEHPITKYIPRDFFNKNLTLKEEKEINVVFLGFGKVNYELFKLMATNFQFAKQKDGKLYAAPVHYYTFENNSERLANEHFIKLINNYDEIFKGSDLPPAEKICDLKDLLPMDAHSAEARKQLRALVNKDTYTYFIISIANDFQDAAFANELKKCLDEETNYKIFVRAKCEEELLFENKDNNVLYFGDNTHCFLHENIVNRDLMELSQNVNNLYNQHTKEGVGMLREWQKLAVVEQYSNIDAALNIYFKLNMMGFTLEKAAGGGVSKEDFINACPDAFMGAKGGDYDFFFETTTANVLAFIEHSRWNAYYLLSGYKPLPFEQFIWKQDRTGKDVLQHKDEEKNRHACLTTYYGLDKLICYKEKTLKEATDRKVGEVTKDALAAIYRYDYMVIDGMYDALTKLGYSIVKRR